MMKDVLLFLWIFIIPIVIWLIKLCFSKRVALNLQNVNLVKKIFLKIILGCYIGVELFVYIGGALLFFILYSQDSSIASNLDQEFREFIYRFCLFQVAILDLFFLYFTTPKYLIKSFSWLGMKTQPWLSKIKAQKESVAGAFLPVILLLILQISIALNIIIPFGVVYFHVESLQDMFIEQKVPMMLIVLVLLFNPLYMFCQLKQRMCSHV